MQAWLRRTLLRRPIKEFEELLARQITLIRPAVARPAQVAKIVFLTHDTYADGPWLLACLKSSIVAVRSARDNSSPAAAHIVSSLSSCQAALEVSPSSKSRAASCWCSSGGNFSASSNTLSKFLDVLALRDAPKYASRMDD